MKHTNGESGTEGKRTGSGENNTYKEDMGAFSDDQGFSGMEESEDIAIEFAEDPIEKNKQNHKNRGNNQRAIPDRARLEDLREQALNNFMLSPWVIPDKELQEDHFDKQAQVVSSTMNVLKPLSPGVATAD